ncbi:hypothetical protein PR048_025336 [Dryococelus australis]|uniref:Uncharacterized protein n=1 Tax=Dryococelus australis TaxID=614101 RepID=A0ABQ9GR56_9NEOP|nr:hypothetical protein PR048_025336 [Dryococelus australis]
MSGSQSGRSIFRRSASASSVLHEILALRLSASACGGEEEEEVFVYYETRWQPQRLTLPRLRLIFIVSSALVQNLLQMPRRAEQKDYQKIHGRGCDASQVERDRCGVMVILFASHQGEPGSIPGGAASGLSHVGTVPDDAAGRWVFSGISRFPAPSFRRRSRVTSLYPHQLSSPRFKSRPNLFIHSKCGNRKVDSRSFTTSLYEQRDQGE